MQIKAQLKRLRTSPRKVRLVADLIRGMDVEDAKSQLEFVSKKSSKQLLKLLNSAIANAQNNFNLDVSNLYISKIVVDEGPTLKRWRPRAMGRAASIRKRTSHITIVLDEREQKGEKQKNVSASS